MEFGLDKRDKCGMMKFNNMKLFVTVNIEDWSLRNIVSSETCKFNTRSLVQYLDTLRSSYTEFQEATILVVKTHLTPNQPTREPSIGFSPLMFFK